MAGELVLLERRPATFTDLNPHIGRVAVGQQFGGPYYDVPLGQVLAQATIRHGRESILDGVTVSTIDLVLIGQGIRSIKCGQVLEVDTADGSPRFRGWITDATIEWDGLVGQATLTAAGPLSMIARRKIGYGAYPQELWADRVARVLADAGLQPDDYVLEGPPAGEDFEMAPRAAEETSVHAQLEELAATGGAAIVDQPDGRILVQALAARAAHVVPPEPPPGGTGAVEFVAETTSKGLNVKTVQLDGTHSCELLLLWIAYNSANSVVELGVSGSGLTWELVGRAWENGQNTRVMVYAAIVPAGTITDPSATLDVPDGRTIGMNLSAWVGVDLADPWADMVTAATAGSAVPVFSILGLAYDQAERDDPAATPAVDVPGQLVPAEGDLVIAGMNAAGSLTAQATAWGGLSETELTRPAPSSGVNLAVSWALGDGVEEAQPAWAVQPAARCGGVAVVVRAAPAAPPPIDDLPAQQADRPALRLPTVVPPDLVLWAPAWSQSLDVANVAEVGYGPIEDPHLAVTTNTDSVSRYGERSTEVESRFAAEVDARARGTQLVNRRGYPRWGISSCELRGLLEPRVGDTIELVGLPAESPVGDTWRPVVEGWTDTLDGETWTTAVSFSDPSASGLTISWAQVPVDQTWAGLSGVTWNEAYTANDLRPAGALSLA